MSLRNPGQLAEGMRSSIVIEDWRGIQSGGARVVDGFQGGLLAPRADFTLAEREDC